MVSRGGPCGSLGNTTSRTAGTSSIHFSRMRSKGSRFTLGVWGLRVCSLDVAFVVATVRNRSQPPFATVRNRSQPSATVRTNSRSMAVPMGSSAEVVIFGGFQCVVVSFRVALRDIKTCSAT